MLRSPAAADGAPAEPDTAALGAAAEALGAAADALGDGVAPPPHATATNIAASESAAMGRTR
jgi:hypothetical protein